MFVRANHYELEITGWLSQMYLAKSEANGRCSATRGCLARGGCVLRTLAAVIGIKRQDDGTLGRGKKFSLLPKKVSLHRSSHLMEQL